MTKEPKIREASELTIGADRNRWLTLESSYGLTLESEDWDQHKFEIYRITSSLTDTTMRLIGIEA